MTKLKPSFIPRDTPLTPTALLAIGDAKFRLRDHLLNQDNESLSALEAVIFDDALFIKGESDALPWVDGISYLGVDPDAPRIWLPTHTKPNIASDIFAGAIRKHIDIAAPLAVLLSPKRVLPVGDARALSHALLNEYCR